MNRLEINPGGNRQGEAVTIGVFRRAIKVVSGVAGTNKVAARKVDGRERAVARKTEGAKGR
jgi:hypothetical protein